MKFEYMIGIGGGKRLQEIALNLRLAAGMFTPDPPYPAEAHRLACSSCTGDGLPRLFFSLRVHDFSDDRQPDGLRTSGDMQIPVARRRIRRFMRFIDNERRMLHQYAVLVLPDEVVSQCDGERLRVGVRTER